VRDKLSDFFDIPSECIGGDSLITVAGTHEISVYGCRSILEYGQDCVLVRLSRGKVSVQGKQLEVHALVGDQITVRGKIIAVHLHEQEEGE